MNQVLTSGHTVLGSARNIVQPNEGVGRSFVESRCLSDLLLRLYGAARTCTITAFQDQAMDLVAIDLPFDASWWGRSTVVDQGHQVHCSHLRNLPDDVPERLNRTDSKNVVAQRSTCEPDQAHIFSENELFTKPATAALADHMRVRQVMGIATVDHKTGLVSFLSVARHSGKPAFRERERQLLELLLPHLMGALDLCCATHMFRLRHKDYGDASAMIATDIQGFLHVSEPGAEVILQHEWPMWAGSRLPEPLVQHIVQRRPFFLGQHIRADIHWYSEHVWLTLRPRKLQDMLTPQECAVAAAFSSGQTYKEVARKLLIAPATVRHHLRAVYIKLDISDKAELAHKFGAQADDSLRLPVISVESK